MTGRTISAAWVKGIVDLLQDADLNPRTLFEEAGVNIDEVSHSDARFEPEKISVLWELAAERSGNPDIGLAMPQVAKPASFDAVAYVMMSCPSLLAGLERLVRYLRIISDAADLVIHEEEQGYGITVELYGGGRPVPRPRIDFVLLTIVNFCRWLTGRDMHPLAVDFPRPEPSDLQPYHAAFQCPCHFNAPMHRLHFSRADLTLSLPTSNPVLAELHDRFAGEHLHRLDSARTSYKARELIIRRLPDGEPLRGDIAKALCMSERTLQRRLHDEQTSFHQLVDDTRRELARDYLGQVNLTLAQIACLLGFADQSNFFRACKRWFDMSPGEYRGRPGKNGKPPVADVAR